MYVLDQYKTQEICNKVILENDRLLRFIPDCNKNKKMSYKTVVNYFHDINNCQAVKVLY